jgi:sec-independent protein translocase protein TatB
VPSINGFEVIVLAVLALVILGPEKLPRYAADAGRMIRSLRAMAADARREVTESLGPEFKDIDLGDLNPRGFAKRHLLDPDDYDLGLDDDDEEPRARRRSRRASSDEPDAAAPRRRDAGSSTADGAPRQRDNGSSRTGSSPTGAADLRGNGATAMEPTAPRAPYDPDAT